MAVKKVALLTAGGLAPCLSSAVGGLIERYTELAPDVEIICYRSGYKGLLLGDSFSVTVSMREQAGVLHRHGGSPIGNSRVKLTNVEDCIKRGLIQEGQNPLEIAAERLEKDGVDVLHTIGGDDTNITAADLAAFLAKNNFDLTVVGLPKTIDNDVIPIRQSLGAWTAAEHGARFFDNVVAEHNANPRMLIIHEVMGRNCGWLTAATSREYRRRLHNRKFLPSLLIEKERWDIDAVYIPEVKIDIKSESYRLKKRMDEKDSINIFLSEGAGIDSIVREMEENNEEVRRDAFGHVRLDEINPGQWFAKQFSRKIDADKVLVQKSGYFARSAKPNAKDLGLIFQTADLAVECAISGESGVVGLDEDNNNQLACIEFDRIKGGKRFNPQTGWFQSMLKEIGQ